MNYNTKVVLVTGGANGIGKAIVECFCKEGAKVIIADKDSASGLKLEKRMKDVCCEVEFYEIDFKNHEEIKRMMEYIEERGQGLHIVVNNVGISKHKKFTELELEEWQEIIDVNLRSTFIISKEFAKINNNSCYGRVINIASTRALMSEPGWEAYAASKGGIVSLTHAMAISLSNTNITVNCISPGWIEVKDYKGLTENDHAQHPSSRVGKAEDIARVCLFLTDDKNGFINGENIVIDGGITKKMIYE